MTDARITDPKTDPTTTASAVAPAADFSFELLETLSHVEMDRFCEKCAYNLRGQPVRRDLRTEILLARCPECGKYESVTDSVTAGRQWLSRLSKWLLGQWIGVLILLLLANPLFLTILTMGGTYEVQWYEKAIASSNRYYRGNTDDVFLFVAMMFALSWALGGLWAMLIVTLMPHWKRAAYLFAIVIVPAVVAALSMTLWHLDFGDRPWGLHWAWPYILTFAGMNLLGGAMGGHFGRNISRLIASICLPLKLRRHLGYLWEVDGKPMS